MGDKEKKEVEFIVSVDEIRTIEALESGTFSQRSLKFNPQFTIFRKAIAMCVELVHGLGNVPPRDDYDRTQRDLACDTLDSLWLAESALLGGYDNQALVLLRRSYESVSLMAFFFNFPERVKEWGSGKIIPQKEVRRGLGSAPVPESEKHLARLYEVYSLFTHVNRKTVLIRLLGEPNRFTLGCQGNVSEKHVGAIVRELLTQTVWFVDVFQVVFAKLSVVPRELGLRLLGYRDEVGPLVKDLPVLF
jgi:hypothetical protein